MDVLTVITCPALRPQYLAETLRQLDREGASSLRRYVICDGMMTDAVYVQIPDGWRIVIKPGGPSGTRRVMWWTYRFVLDDDRVDRLIYCEDDLIVGSQAITQVISHVIPDDIAFISYFDQREFHPFTVEPGLQRVPVNGLDNRGLWGSLMNLLPRRTMEFLVSKDAWPPRPGTHGGWLDPWPENPNAADCVMTHALGTYSPWHDRLVHAPSLVDHAGAISAFSTKRIRKARWFIGRTNYDAIPAVLCRTCLRDWPCEDASQDGHEKLVGESNVPVSSATPCDEAIACYAAPKPVVLCKACLREWPCDQSTEDGHEQFGGEPQCLSQEPAGSSASGSYETG